jgi:tryptophan-rich sensory protein
LVYLIFFQKNKNLLMLYISNIIMNLLYWYFQWPDVSAYVLLFLIVWVLFTIIYFSVLIRKVNKYVFVAQIPYVIRVFIATNLWISVMFLNKLF